LKYKKRRFHIYKLSSNRIHQISRNDWRNPVSNKYDFEVFEDMREYKKQTNSKTLDKLILNPAFPSVCKYSHITIRSPSRAMSRLWQEVYSSQSGQFSQLWHAIRIQQLWQCLLWNTTSCDINPSTKSSSMRFEVSRKTSAPRLVMQTIFQRFFVSTSISYKVYIPQKFLFNCYI
jgi:hypothetical protein